MNKKVTAQPKVEMDGEMGYLNQYLAQVEELAQMISSTPTTHPEFESPARLHPERE